MILLLAGAPTHAQEATAPQAETTGQSAANTSDGTPPAATAAAAEDAASDAMTISPLAPAPTGSPYDTYRSFRTYSEAATADLVAAFYESDEADTGLLFESDEVRRLKYEALANLRKAITTLDLSDVAPANRRTVGINAVLLLEEIFARIPLPDAATIPDSEDVGVGAAARGWTLPGTQIQMIRSETLSGGPRYLFSPETVAQLPRYYEAVRTLPRQGDSEIDFYQHFVSAPGLSMPVQLYRFILDLPEWTRILVFEQALWQWIALVVLTVAYGGLAYMVLNAEARRSSTAQGVAASFHRLAMPVLVILFLGAYRWLCDNVINLTGDALAYVELAIESLQTLALAVLVLFVFNFVAALIISSPRISKESLDASLIRLVMKVIGFVAAGFIVFFGATRIGLPVYGIVAGLGVGGLAIALAVRPTLENFVGGIILYADRPVKVGDFCQFGNMLGTVEEIGLRSTKVRSLNRTLVTVQNSEFSQMSITNFSRRDANLMQSVVRLRHETSAEQLRAVIEGIAAMLKADPKVKGDTVRVCLLDIAEFAYNVEIWCYIDTADFTQFLKVKEGLLMKVVDVIEENGTALARPAQTTYLTQDRASNRAAATETPSLTAAAPAPSAAPST